MSSEIEKYSRNIANSSGFPLQIRIANIVNSEPSWKVLLEEHPWRSEETNSEGFLDIVIIHGDRDVMVIECKRVQQAAWVFLITHELANWSRACLFRSEYADSIRKSFEWFDFQAEPSTYETKFCAIPGQNQGRRNSLERTASGLIDGIEALARQEAEINKNRASTYFERAYIPVIVTTAELMVSLFTPSDISLKNGSLPPDAIFQRVPFIRFRKSLTTRPPSPPIKSIEKAHKMAEKTVFIVNAEEFQRFLQEWRVRVWLLK